MADEKKQTWLSDPPDIRKVLAYDKKSLTAYYETVDGDVLVRKGGSIPWRFNNPGDISYSSDAIYNGMVGAAGGWSVFDNLKSGKKAIRTLLKSTKVQKRTIREEINRYAPSKDPRNRTGAYISSAVHAVGLDENDGGADTVISKLSDSQLEELAKVIERNEGYSAYVDKRVEFLTPLSKVQVIINGLPASNIKLIVQQGSATKEVNTDKFGNANIPHGKNDDGGLNSNPIKIFFKEALDIASKNKEVAAAMVNPALGLALVIDNIAKSGSYSILNKIASFSAQTAPHAPPEKKQKGSNEFHDYHVVPNDSLSLIAKKFKTSVDAIKQDNKLKGDMIHPGMVLKIVYGKKTEGSEATTEAKEPQEKPVESNKVGEKKADEKQADSAQSSAKKNGDDVVGSSGQQTTKVIPKDKESSASSQPIPTEKQKSKKVNQEKVSLPMVTATSARGAVNYMGHPLALVEFPPTLAPWMKYAISEAEYWGGADETEIVKNHEYKDSSGETKLTKGVNYHTASPGSTKIPDMSGTNHAWCASFVNYILAKSNYSPLNLPGGGNALARNFAKDTVNFEKIQNPVFGAIAVLNYPHATFVLGWQNGQRGRLLVCLGGNQGGHGSFGGTISFSMFPAKDVIGYFLPKLYAQAVGGNAGLKDMLDPSGAEKYMPDLDKSELNKKYEIKESNGKGVR